MPTEFTTKQYKDKLYYTEVNSIFKAINDLEAAINIQIGTSNAAIPSSNIQDLNAAKLFGAGNIDGLTTKSLDVSESATLNAQISLGDSGVLALTNSQGIETIKLGLLSLSEDATPVGYHGLRVSDGINVNFLASEEGEVSLRGKIIALSGSEFTGKVNITSGTILEAYNVGAGITLDGKNNQIIVNELGKIVAGDSTLTKQGIDFKQGTINLEHFKVDGQGNLIATNANVTGEIHMTGGTISVSGGGIGGIKITPEGLYAAEYDATPVGSWFMFSKDGYAEIYEGLFTGEVYLKSGAIEGNILINGQLTAPGFVLGHDGATFTQLSLNLGNGRLVVEDGKLTASEVNLTGAFSANSGSILGVVSIGNIKLDGVNKKIIAGNNELAEQTLTFKSGQIDFGENFSVNSANGILHAKNAEIHGKLSGEFHAETGTIGGLGISATALYKTSNDATPVTTPLNSFFVIDGQGSIKAFKDRANLGIGHQEKVIASLDENGLFADEGHVSIRTAVDGAKEVRFDSTGLRAIRDSLNEVIITGDGIKLKSNGEVSAPIIAPEGFNAEFLQDGSLTSNKFLQTRPSKITFVICEGALVQTNSGDYGELTIKWPMVMTREDLSELTDLAGYRIYLMGGRYDTFQCIAVVGPEPDYPDALPEDSTYNLKVFKKEVEKNTTYNVAVVAFDRLGNESERTYGSTYIEDDRIAPSEPVYVHAYPGPYFVKLEWSFTEDIDFKEYLVEKQELGKDWVFFTSTVTNHLVDKNVSVDKDYKYRVATIDRSGNRSAFTESEWTAPNMLTSEQIGDGMITSAKLEENISIRGFITIGDGAILVPNIGEMMVEVTPSTPDATPVGSTPVTFPIEYLRILENSATPTAKGIDVANILIEKGEIVLPEDVDTLTIADESATPNLKNLRAGLLNGVDIEEFKSSFDLHLLSFGSHQTDFEDHLLAFASHLQDFSTHLNTFNTHTSKVDAHHSNANDPTTDEKFALSGTEGTPSDANRYVTDLDYRLSDERVPILHGDDKHNELGYFKKITDGTTTITANSAGQQIKFAGSGGASVSINLDKNNIPTVNIDVEDIIGTDGNFEVSGDILLGGNIVPVAATPTSIGTPDNRFYAIYADELFLSTNTLWLGDTPVLGTDDTTIIIRSDPGQYIRIMSDSGTEMVATGMNADVKIQSTGTGGRVVMGADTEVRMTAPQTIVSGNLSVTGDLIVNGNTLIVNTQTVEVKDNILVLNSGQVGSGVSAGQAGIKVDRGDAPDYMIVFDEDEDMFKVGMVGDLETIASQNYVQSQLESFEFFEFAEAAELSATKAKASEDKAKASETNAKTSETNAASSASAAADSEDAASNSKAAAASSASDAATSATNAANAEAKAKKWADEAVDVEVEEGKYSAKHWAQKAEESAGNAETLQGHPASDFADAEHTHTRTTITSKPSTFTPSTHAHPKSEISDFPSSMPANGGNADTVGNLQSSYLLYSMVASNDILLQANTTRNTTSTSNVLVKAFKVDRPGVYRVTFDMRTSFSMDSANVVIEEKEASTSSTAYANYYLDVPVRAGSLPYTLNIYLRAGGMSGTAYIRNVHLCGKPGSYFTNTVVKD